jgi:hypothetical protein
MATTLRTMKNAIIKSSIDGIRHYFEIEGILRNRSLRDRPCCTVKEIPLSELNFPPHDDLMQHLTQAATEPDQ